MLFTISREDQVQRCHQSDRWVTDSEERTIPLEAGAPPHPVRLCRVRRRRVTELLSSRQASIWSCRSYKYLATLTLDPSEHQTLSGSSSSAASLTEISIRHGNKSRTILILINVEIGHILHHKNVRVFELKVTQVKFKADPWLWLSTLDFKEFEEDFSKFHDNPANNLTT